MSRSLHITTLVTTLGATLAVISACSGDDGDDRPAPVIVSGMLGPAGGTLEAPCGTLEIPAGALAQDTEIAIETLSPALAPPLETAGSFCKIDLQGAELATPAALTLRYDSQQFPDGVPPTLFAISQPLAGGPWSPLWMPALPNAGALPASITAGGTFGPALALANNTACLASIGFCAIQGPPPIKPAPPTWTPIPGTSAGQYELDALFKYFDNAGFVSEGLCAINLACFADRLSAQAILDIRVKCKKLPCPYDLVCAAQIVRAELSKDGSNVCRHYAWAMREAAAELGHSANFECGWYDSVGHAWVKVDCGGQTYLLDAFADTYVSISGPVPPKCGNELVETGEQCDGSASTCTPAASDCEACQCVPHCGNGKLDEFEECDGSAGSCPTGEVCNGCLCEPPPVVPVCGNGEIESGEECEWPVDCDSGSDCESCKCVVRCGNGKIDPGEDCDDVAGGCDASHECLNCQCLALCGNGKIDAGEECDGTGMAQCTTVGEGCYKCQCMPFVQCAGIIDQNTCLGCCEGATTNQTDFGICASTHCP